MKKKIFIGVGLLAVGALGYLALKNKRKKDGLQEQVIEEQAEADFDFENVDGKKNTGLQNIISKPKKIIKVKDYQALIRNGSLEQLNKYLVGKNIYTLQNDVNLRRDHPYVNNGIRNNKVITIKNKGVYIAKVKEVVTGLDGKSWFLIDTESRNPAFESSPFYDLHWFLIIPIGESAYDVYVRADVVVVDLY
jgi:hypothetical protein